MDQESSSDDYVPTAIYESDEASEDEEDRQASPSLKNSQGLSSTLNNTDRLLHITAGDDSRDIQPRTHYSPMTGQQHTAIGEYV